MSVDRADRTGPTGFDISEWNSAANRVMPPSTPSSKTTSAWLSPIWGRALGALSIFTTRTGRFEARMSIGRPVSGEAAVVDGFGRVVVVVGFGRVVVVVDVVVVGGGLTVSTRRKSTPQALPATNRSTGSTVNRGRRWRWGLSAVMSTAERTGSGPKPGGPSRSVGVQHKSREPSPAVLMVAPIGPKHHGMITPTTAPTTPAPAVPADPAATAEVIRTDGLTKTYPGRGGGPVVTAVDHLG